MPAPKIERLLAGGSLHPTGQRASNIETISWMVALAIALGGLLYLYST